MDACFFASAEPVALAPGVGERFVDDLAPGRGVCDGDGLGVAADGRDAASGWFV
ncbi:MAG TPA: hypothetical protein VE172_12930 [Stackebrandtia sp.]|uniref:hypothetical protein n=1 Tax=Stackebrandtia sp. TaxID=2023065 RepID=UPI002D5A813B|nr:hypothetical protein [Stackebrandtia sp.]HZE39705.1 hypothetical protein [Stackebrandtia sp.]